LVYERLEKRGSRCAFLEHGVFAEKKKRTTRGRAHLSACTNTGGDNHGYRISRGDGVRYSIQSEAGVEKEKGGKGGNPKLARALSWRLGKKRKRGRVTFREALGRDAQTHKQQTEMRGEMPPHAGGKRKEKTRRDKASTVFQGMIGKKKERRPPFFFLPRQEIDRDIQLKKLHLKRTEGGEGKFTR